MNNRHIFTIFILVLISFIFLISQQSEGFRGGRGGGRGGGLRGGRWGGRWGGRGGGRWVGRWGGIRHHGGYNHRGRRPIYNSSWWSNVNNSFFWPQYRFWGYPCLCKRGCTPEGCAFPGNGPNDCVWAADCNCCTFY